MLKLNFHGFTHEVCSLYKLITDKDIQILHTVAPNNRMCLRSSYVFKVNDVEFDDDSSILLVKMRECIQNSAFSCTCTLYIRNVKLYYSI